MADYGYVGMLLAFAIFFAITTILLPVLLSLPSRLHLYLRRLRHYLRRRRPTLTRFVPRVSLPRLLQIVPHNPNPVKNSTFECGMETIGQAWVRFNFRYYYYALIFIALDVLVVFLYPWAVELRGLGLPGLISAVVFLAIAFVGYIYAWKKKVLEWK